MPEEFANTSSISLTAEESREILNSIGINIPSYVSKDPTIMGELIRDTPKLTEEQLREYFLKVLELKGER